MPQRDLGHSLGNPAQYREGQMAKKLTIDQAESALCIFHSMLRDDAGRGWLKRLGPNALRDIAISRARDIEKVWKTAGKPDHISFDLVFAEIFVEYCLNDDGSYTPETGLALLLAECRN